MWRRNNAFHYIDTDEIPGFFLILRNLSYTCKDTGITLVTRHERASCSGARPVLFKFHSQNGFSRYAFAVIEFVSSSLEFCNKKCKYYCLYFSFRTLYPSFITFL